VQETAAKQAATHEQQVTSMQAELQQLQADISLQQALAEKEPKLFVWSKALLQATDPTVSWKSSTFEDCVYLIFPVHLGVDAILRSTSGLDLGPAE